LLLGYCSYVVLDSWAFQKRADQELERRLVSERDARAATSREGTGAPSAPPPAIGPDGLIGRIEVQRIGLAAVVFEGTGKSTLRRAVGHIPRTALPGQWGNVGIAGHRDTFFRPLRSIQQDDVIKIITLRGEYRYRVVSTRVVLPTEVSMLDPNGGQYLTLVTCYPFSFVGSAPKRFIVRAERITDTS
jgi:sortase A